MAAVELPLRWPVGVLTFEGYTLKGGQGRQGGQELTRMRNSALLPFYICCSSCCCFAFVLASDAMHAFMRIYIVMYFINSLTHIK